MAVRELEVSRLRDEVARLLARINCEIPGDVLDALRAGAARERSVLGKHTLEQLVRNYELAATTRVPVCQDSGMTVVFLDVGQDVHWTGGALQEAVRDGVREGTRAGFLRWSVTGDPLRRLKMAGDDAPAAIHVDLVPGDAVHLKDNWDAKRVPAINNDKAKSAASMQHMAELMAANNAQLWINHDKPQSLTMKRPPEFYR